MTTYLILISLVYGSFFFSLCIADVEGEKRKKVLSNSVWLHKESTDSIRSKIDRISIGVGRRQRSEPHLIGFDQISPTVDRSRHSSLIHKSNTIVLFSTILNRGILITLIFFFFISTLFYILSYKVLINKMLIKLLLFESSPHITSNTFPFYFLFMLFCILRAYNIKL